MFQSIFLHRFTQNRPFKVKKQAQIGFKGAPHNEKPPKKQGCDATDHAAHTTSSFA